VGNPTKSGRARKPAIKSGFSGIWKLSMTSRVSSLATSSDLIEVVEVVEVVQVVEVVEVDH
jgi:hypothetical protein